MISQRAIDAIEASDTDELLRVIDGYCENDEWALLGDLRFRCREAVGRGKQLWGVEEHIRYRLALEAPGDIAGPIVCEGDARFTLGPLAEVAASTKNWAELSPHLDKGPVRETVAAERVVRGDSVDTEIPGLPATLLDWEPEYPTAVYKADRVDAPSPKTPSPRDVSLPRDAIRIDDPHSEGALADLVEPWTDQSNGRCQTTTVEGEAHAAIRSLGLGRARIAELTPGEAMQWMAWTAASGGAHGRRRGAAAGRYLAWWAVATLADLDWPAAPEDVEAATTRLRWYWFDDGSPDTGWVFRLAIEDRDIGIAWAISAVDVL